MTTTPHNPLCEPDLLPGDIADNLAAVLRMLGALDAAQLADDPSTRFGYHLAIRGAAEAAEHLSALLSEQQAAERREAGA